MQHPKFNIAYHKLIHNCQLVDTNSCRAECHISKYVLIRSYLHVLVIWTFMNISDIVYLSNTKLKHTRSNGRAL